MAKRTILRVIKAVAIVAVIMGLLNSLSVVVISFDRADPVQTVSTERIVKDQASDPFAGEVYLEFVGYDQLRIASFQPIFELIPFPRADWTHVSVQSYRMCNQDQTICTSYLVQDCDPVLDDGWQAITGIYVRTDQGRVAFQGSEFNQVTATCKTD